jgi:hypothetical protein
VDRYWGDPVADSPHSAFRLALPQLLDPNNDAWLPEGKDEQQECLFVGDGEVNEHSPRKSSSGNSGAFAITYSCNA